MTDMQKQALEIIAPTAGMVSDDSLRPGDARFIEAVHAAEKALSAKYPGIAFELFHCIPRNIDRPFDELQLRMAGYDDPVSVHIAEIEGEWIITDNAYGILNREAYERRLAGLLDGAAPGVRAFATIPCLLDERCGAAMPIAEAADDAAFFAYVWLLLPPSDTPFEARAAALRQGIEAADLSGEFTVYALLSPLDPCARRQEVFRLIPAHSSASPVYSAMARFTHRGAGEPRHI